MDPTDFGKILGERAERRHLEVRANCSADIQHAPFQHVAGPGAERSPWIDRYCCFAPNIVDRTFAIIRSIRDAGTTVLLVERNAFAALEMCDHAYLLENGRIVLSGAGAELIENEHVRKAYLGG